MKIIFSAIILLFSISVVAQPISSLPFLVTGNTNTYLITPTKELYGWGSFYKNPHNSDEFDQPQKSSLQNIIQVVNLDDQSYALDSHGRVFLLGSPKEAPQLMRLAEPAMFLFAGGYIFSNSILFYLSTSGKVYGLGQNAEGQLGIGITSEYEANFREVISLKEITAAVSAEDATFALDKNGDVYGWGEYEVTDVQSSHSGTSYSINRLTVPKKITALSDIISIFAGGDYLSGGVVAYALNKTGNVYVWGATPELMMPKKVSNLSDVVKMVTDHHEGYAALTKAGKVFAWDRSSSVAPTEVIFAEPIVNLFFSAAGARFATTAQGEVYAWGYNYYGNLGLGRNHDVVTVPVKIPGLINVEEIASEGMVAFARTKDRKIYAWGPGGSGLGIGAQADQLSPVRATNLELLLIP